jgi:hypothetical protein
VCVLILLTSVLIFGFLFVDRDVSCPKRIEQPRGYSAADLLIRYGCALAQIPHCYREIAQRRELRGVGLRRWPANK